MAFTESKSSIISVSKAIVKTLTVAEYVRPVRIGDGIPLRGQAEPERHCILTRLAPGKRMEVTGFHFTEMNASYVVETE